MSTTAERLSHAQQTLKDALHVLDKSIEDLQEHRARVQEALEELTTLQEDSE